MKKEEYTGIIDRIAAMLGVAPNHRDSERIASKLDREEEKGDFGRSDVLRKLVRTVETVKRTYPGLEPAHTDWYDDVRENPIRQIQYMFHSIAESISQGISDEYCIDFLRVDEVGIRSLIHGGNTGITNNQIRLGGFVVSEKCLGGCRRTCAIGADASGPQMPWELFDAATSSTEIQLVRDMRGDVWLGDGEVLLYKQGERKLIDVIRKLVLECGRGVKFTTAGLIPQNREPGITFFEGLRELGPYSSEVRITLSFNYLFGFIRNDKDIDRYEECVRETLGRISAAGCRMGMVVLATTEGYGKTMEGYERVEADAQKVERWQGRADIRNGVNGIGNAASFGSAPAGETPGRCRSMADNSYALRPDGSLTMDCRGFGIRGSRIGNVLSNNAAQIEKLRKKHDKAFAREVLGKKGCPCRAHQKWKRGRFTARRSARPLLGIK